MSEEKYLTFALGKGRLADKTMELFESIGIFCPEMKDKKSRKLIFTNEEKKLRFFLAKGPDVPSYVENGAADIGVVGEDTLIEEDRNLYKVLDLEFGKCTMCVCGFEKSRELLLHHEFIRVASKYPRIARDYFENVKHQTVDIVKLNGSVELAPIVGLSDVIVDIVVDPQGKVIEATIGKGTTPTLRTNKDLCDEVIRTALSAKFNAVKDLKNAKERQRGSITYHYVP